MCRPNKDNDCNCAKNCHECIAANATWANGDDAGSGGDGHCNICKNKHYLFEGTCVLECPVDSAVPRGFGTGTFNRKCVSAAPTSPPQAPGQDAAGGGGGGGGGGGDAGPSPTVTQGAADSESERGAGEEGDCVCTDCLAGSCVCDGSATQGHCLLCSNFKFLHHGQCVASCHPFKGYFAHGENRFGR